VKYLVRVTSDTTVSTMVDVEADSKEEAEDKAYQEANNSPENFDWVQDEGNALQPYLAGDPGENAEEVP
jgi:hypothetical protein